MMENNCMRDIVERLELQAFVADKIQSGMKPLIMDCLEEITRLRAENEKLEQQVAEFVNRFTEDMFVLRAENEMLRRDVKTAVMGDSAELADAKRENEKLREALKPFSDIEPLFCDSDEMEFELWLLVKADGTIDRPMIKVGDLRAAAAAIRESGE